MEPHCTSIIDKLNKKYKTINLVEFMKNDITRDNKFSPIQIFDKISDVNLASIYYKIDHRAKYINIALVTRYKLGNVRDMFTKGLGKLLMYIIACKAHELGYNVDFTANPSKDDRLTNYYNSIGFTRKNRNTRSYRTLPIELLPKIIESDSSFKEIDTIETFIPTWLKNAYGQYVIQCPVCNNTSGTLLQLIHNYDCSNKNKIPDLSTRPTNSVGGKRCRMTKKKTNGTRVRR